MAAWPSTLPAPMVEGYQEAKQAGMIRSTMEQGVPKQRRRFTATAVYISVNYSMTPAQLAILEAFYNVTLLQGAVSFSWTRPRTDAAVTARFMEPYNVQAQTRKNFLVSCKIEVLP